MGALAVLAIGVVVDLGASPALAANPPGVEDYQVRIPTNLIEVEFRIVQSHDATGDRGFCGYYLYWEFDGELYGDNPRLQPDGHTIVEVDRYYPPNQDKVMKYATDGPLYFEGGLLDGQVKYVGDKYVLAANSISYTGTFTDYPDGRASRCSPRLWEANKAAARASTEEYSVWTRFPVTVHQPTANFEFSPAPDDPLQIRFTNTSTDVEDEPGDLTCSWVFHDGTTSDECSPTKQYAASGVYDVTLTVTDTSARSASVTKPVPVMAGLVVNSTGDAPADDPEAACDTGADVGDQPECTLRAAIEVANASNGGDITFDIAGSGVPEVALGSPLPALVASTSIDGTSQAGGWVEVTGGGETALELKGGTSTVRGLALHGADVEIMTTGGSGHVVEGNRMGLDGAGVPTDDTVQGVGVGASADTTIAENQMVVGVGVATSTPVPASGLVVRDNRIGTTADGGARLGSGEAGIFINAPGAEVSGNVVSAATVGIAIVQPSAAATTVSQNYVGVSPTGTGFAGQGFGIRVEGSPDVTVQGNHIGGTVSGRVIVSGSVQAYRDEAEDEIVFVRPEDDPLDTPVTGGGVKVTENDIGFVGGDGDSGIVSWAGAVGTEVRGNRIVGVTEEGVRLDGGRDHVVTDNDIATTDDGVDHGVEVDGAADVTIGGVGGAANRIAYLERGVLAEGDAPGLRVERNELTGIGAGDDRVGIEAGDGAPGAVAIGNVLQGGHHGIALGGATAQVTGNTLRDAGGTAIITLGDGATVSGNVVVDGGAGISVKGEDVTILMNRVGLEESGDEVHGVAADGVRVLEGTAEVGRNAIAGSGEDGIGVDVGAEAELRSNRVWESGGLPISVADGPVAPTLAAAMLPTSGDAERTTLLVGGLPAGEAGQIEVFANSSCTDGEAERVVELVRTKRPEEQRRVLQVRSATFDHYTVTYTDPDGRTSELSNCVDEAVPADGDGDGAPDPLDGILGVDDDPTVGIVATDNEDLLMLGVVPLDPETGIGGGHFEQIEVGADPTPTEHPAGWSLPYGALSFRIGGLDPGGRTRVFLASLGTDPVAGTSYWKYGPPQPGAAPTWYPFDYDAATDTGAVSVVGTLPLLGSTRFWGLALGDGLRGDRDGAANGTITDPGGPVIGVPPVGPTTTTTTVATTTTTSSGNANPTVTSTTGAPSTPAVDDGTLPRTGSTAGSQLAAALLALIIGAVLVGISRRTRQPT